jgi:hypothetical protein
MEEINSFQLAFLNKFFRKKKLFILNISILLSMIFIIEVSGSSDLPYGKKVSDIVRVPLIAVAGDMINPEGIIDLQQGRVSGTVTDDSGNPLPGVTVLVKGTGIGTLTDASGKYTLDNVPPNSTMAFSFVGMTAQEVSAAGKTQIDVTLKEEAIGLEEVVVVGYGTQRKVSYPEIG